MSVEDTKPSVSDSPPNLCSTLESHFKDLKEKRNHAFFQVVIIGFICFCCPGMFNALQGLGNAGGHDPHIAAIMNATLYGTFAVCGFLSGMLFNLFGTRVLVSVGGCTYAIYSVSVYLWGKYEYMGTLAIIASATLGLGAGLLWTAQGAMIMSYAIEGKKGWYSSVFWIIFNLGGLAGGLVTFGMNYTSDNLSSINPESYFFFCGIMCLGSITSLILLVPIYTVIREDNQPVTTLRINGPKTELINLFGLFKNKKILLLSPYMLYSNWFYTYEFNGFNGLIFNTRTRGLNAALFWGSQMFGAYLFGTFFLDSKRFTRRNRAIYGIVGVGVCSTIQWGLALYLQFGWYVEHDKYKPKLHIDFSDYYHYLPPFCLYLFMGICDALVQNYCYWIMGAISNSAEMCSRFAGYYKCIQSLGASVAWSLDAYGITYKIQLIVCVVLSIISLPPTYGVATMVEEHSHDSEADLGFSEQPLVDMKKKKYVDD